jgi:hypothetical protein
VACPPDRRPAQRPKGLGPGPTPRAVPVGPTGPNLSAPDPSPKCRPSLTEVVSAWHKTRQRSRRGPGRHRKVQLQCPTGQQRYVRTRDSPGLLLRHHSLLVLVAPLRRWVASSNSQPTGTLLQTSRPSRAMAMSARSECAKPVCLFGPGGCTTHTWHKGGAHLTDPGQEEFPSAPARDLKLPQPCRPGVGAHQSSAPVTAHGVCGPGRLPLGAPPRCECPASHPGPVCAPTAAAETPPSRAARVQRRRNPEGELHRRFQSQRRSRHRIRADQLLEPKQPQTSAPVLNRLGKHRTPVPAPSQPDFIPSNGQFANLIPCAVERDFGLVRRRPAGRLVCLGI